MKKNPGLLFVLAATFGLTLASMAAAQTAPTTPTPDLAAIFAGASALPPQADMMPKPSLKCAQRCFQGGATNTSPTTSGSGQDCTAATSALYTQLYNIAFDICTEDLGFDGVCYTITDHYTTDCAFNGAAYEIQGYATFTCSYLICD